MCGCSSDEFADEFDPEYFDELYDDGYFDGTTVPIRGYTVEDVDEAYAEDARLNAAAQSLLQPVPQLA